MKKFHVLLLAAASFMLVSCLELKSTITVSKDGTATIEESVLIKDQAAALMQIMGGGKGGAEQLKALVPDKAKAEKRAQTLGEGVTVKSHEEIKNRDGKSGVKVIYAVADVNKLKYSATEPVQKKDKAAAPKAPITFALNGSTLTLTDPNADKKVGEGLEAPKPGAEDMAKIQTKIAMAKPLLTGMRMTAEIKGANGIASSNATHLNDGTISLLDIEFDKLTDNMDALVGVIQSLEGGTSRTDMAKKFGNIGGVKLEGKGVVTVELK